MRAMRAALPVLSRSVLPVLSPFYARAPSRLVSTEAAGSTAPKSPLAGYVDAMMPFATFIGLVTAVGGIGTLFHSRMTKLEADMAGTAGKLEERVAGAEKSLQERVTGILKEVDAKNTGSEKAVDAKIAGFEKAADLKARFLMRARARLIDPLSHAPSPPHLQYKTK
jgi:hypothetical protein